MEPTRKPGVAGLARESIASVLNHVMAEECSLSATTRDYRWSVTGPNLYSLHRLFDEQRRQLDDWLARLFEWGQAAGVATPEDLEKSSHDASSHHGDAIEPRGMIGDLLARHEEMARRLRDDIARLADPVITDLLGRLIDFHETSAWMLRMLHDGPESVRP